ncbi:hypothetical protein A0U92_05670 [Acetobacter aceti]|uniref:Uncharacterized protein n=1 Tax=Acetobacter aceti TaxID=435 RepID=A0A1U9KEX0_ACEAC|nr:hypothetical protein A0U92_05670 [Acetobacter aceti]
MKTAIKDYVVASIITMVSILIFLQVAQNIDTIFTVNRKHKRRLRQEFKMNDNYKKMTLKDFICVLWPN